MFFLVLMRGLAKNCNQIWCGSNFLSDALCLQSCYRKEAGVETRQNEVGKYETEDFLGSKCSDL